MRLRPLVLAATACLVAGATGGSAAASVPSPQTSESSSAAVHEADKISFGEPTRFRMKRPGFLSAAGDFDQDGSTDLVSLGTEEDPPEFGRGYITIYTGDGAGDFKRSATVEPYGPPSVVRVGDMNGDGDPDLVVASSYRIPERYLSVHLGLPGDEFADAIPLKVRARIMDFELGDLDDDGDLDVVTNGYESEHLLPSPQTILLLENVGDGHLEKRPDLPYNTTDVELGDVDEDGRLDIVAYKLGGIAIFLNEGGWIFDEPETFLHIGRFPTDLTLRDLDGDDHLDLVADVNEGVGIRYGSGDATFEPKEIYDRYGFGEVADINGDGLLDLVFDAAPGVVEFGLAEEGRSYADPVTIETIPDSYVSVVADLDSDGLVDLALTTTSPHRGASMLNASKP